MGIKKIAMLGIISVIFLGLVVGCSEKEDTPEDKAGRIVHDMSVTMMKEFLSGDFINMMDNMNEEMKESVSEQQLMQIYLQLTVNKSLDFDNMATEETSNDGAKSVIVTVPTTVDNVHGIFNYDSEDKLTGFFVNTSILTPEIVVTDKFEEKEIQVGADGFELDGRLTIPTGVEKPPVVIFVHGSGPHGMDSAIGKSGNSPLRDLAHGLAEQGIASIRYNKRMYQEPEDAFKSDMTIHDEVLDDVFATIDYAKTLSEVDTEKIIIVGHSLGGMLAPYIASESEDVKGIVSLAGTPRKLEDVVLSQNESLLTDDEAKLQLDIIRDEIDKIKTLIEDDVDNMEIVVGLPMSYWQSMSQVVSEELASKIPCPALILQGDRDFQVSVEEDYDYWKAIAKDNKSTEFYLFEGLNHLFMPSDGSAGEIDLEEYNTQNKVSEDVILKIAEYIKSI